MFFFLCWFLFLFLIISFETKGIQWNVSKSHRRSKHGLCWRKVNTANFCKDWVSFIHHLSTSFWSKRFSYRVVLLLSRACSASDCNLHALPSVLQWQRPFLQTIPAEKMSKRRIVSNGQSQTCPPGFFSTGGGLDGGEAGVVFFKATPPWIEASIEAPGQGSWP